MPKVSEIRRARLEAGILALVNGERQRHNLEPLISPQDQMEEADYWEWREKAATVLDAAEEAVPLLPCAPPCVD